MEKKILTKEHLKELGFTPKQARFFEEEFSYDWHIIKKNDSELSLTTEYDLNNDVRLQYVEFNGEKLCGDPLGIKELRFLIKLM